ncbi:aspartate racemase [Pseudooceanicola antarcticus]|uniref:Aspartate racemase n=1 Tax=Pseudooceanicola antarcticus TaxID=1247613 RepID=A0A285J342_9RHOB|nr:aspartate/glutamate racemase family protein [Pseudooceanicola antarcticus]PJE29734.1 aspartate/glutamate racemase family protein [Pseudooceanicola antarcticus]SNY54628.1 aspartate racemase [Pseudooceanicola antarcticus]
MHLGLIGGIGVAASLVYYQRLAARVTERGGTLRMTLVHADIQELIANNLAWNTQAQAESYARHIETLRAAGCDCAVITSIGGHFCFPETEALSSLPLVSAIAPLDQHFARQGLKRVGLLGTANVMRTRLFGQMKQTEAVAPDGDLDAIGKLYQDIAVTGFCTGDQRAAFFELGRRMVEDQGAEAVILAGTDLNLAFDRDAGYPVVDALDIHVDLLADLATGRASL